MHHSAPVGNACLVNDGRRMGTRVATALAVLLAALAGLACDRGGDTTPPPPAPTSTPVATRTPTPEPTRTSTPTPMPKPTRTPKPKPTPTPTPTPEPHAGTREDPIPIGRTVALGDGWEVTVLSVTRDATEAILAANEANASPDGGYQYFVARVQATYHGEAPSRFDGRFRLRTIGPSETAYDSFNDTCGVVPEGLPDPEVFDGGTTTGSICWEVLSTDAEALLLFDAPFAPRETASPYLALFGEPDPIPTEAPAGTVTPFPSPDPAEPPGSRANPVPVGTAFALPDGWELTVTAVDSNATRAVLAADPANLRPQKGHRYLLVAISATYRGTGLARFNAGFRLVVLGSSAVGRTTYEVPCGTLPDPFPDQQEVRAGETLRGNVCWVVRTEDVESLRLFDAPLIAGNEPVYFRLTP